MKFPVRAMRKENGYSGKFNEEEARKTLKKKGKSTLCFPDERRVLLHIYLIMETDHPDKGCPG